MSEYNLGDAPIALYSNNSALEDSSNFQTANSRRKDKTDMGSVFLSVSDMDLGLPSPVLLARGQYRTGTLKVCK